MINKNNLFKGALLLALATSGATSGVLAGEQTQSLNDWVQKAAEQIDRKMVYSKTAQRFHDEGVVNYRVTIDDEGNVLKADLVSNTGGRSIQYDTLRTIKRADFPALPASREDTNLTFRLQLTYLSDPSPRELRLHKQRMKSRTSAERLASMITIEDTKTGR